MVKSAEEEASQKEAAQYEEWGEELAKTRATYARLYNPLTKSGDMSYPKEFLLIVQSYVKHAGLKPTKAMEYAESEPQVKELYDRSAKGPTGGHGGMSGRASYGGAGSRGSFTPGWAANSMGPLPPIRGNQGGPRGYGGRASGPKRGPPAVPEVQAVP